MSQLPLPQAFALALQHHQAGRLAEAAQGYRQILAQHPQHAGALHFLGVIAAQMGHSAEAVELIRQALALNPADPVAHTNLGNALAAQGHLAEAIAAYRQAVAHKPNFPEGFYNLANALSKAGQLEEAIAAYRQALNLRPNLAEAWYNLANTLKTRGSADEAIVAYRQALTVKPTYADAQFNLGHVLRDQNRPDEAIAAYRRALELNPNNPQGHFHLGNLLKANGQLESAVAAYRHALRLKPDYPEALSNLGNALQAAGRSEEAIAAYRQAIARQPQRIELYQNLGVVLEKLGRRDEVVALYKEALQCGSASPEVYFHMAAFTGDTPPPAAPVTHLKAMFDQFAETFDYHLVDELEYRAPPRLYDAVCAAAGHPHAAGPASWGDVLDLGCGTGLCAPFFRPFARTLTGVDLSAGMLEKARQRGLYDALILSELHATLQARTQAWDLVIATDVFIYIGDLAPVFAAVATALRPQGLFAFSVEAHDAAGYLLRPSLRYVHSAAYLRALAAQQGFVEISLTSVTLRLEGNQPVPGLIMVLRLPPCP